MQTTSFKFLTAVLVFSLVLNGIFSTSSHAQKSKKKYQSSPEAPFHKGSNTLGLGLGLGVNYGYYGDITSPPAFFLSYDHGVKDNLGPGNLGIGGILAVKSSVYKYGFGGYKSVWRNYIVGVRGTYHLTLLTDKNNKFDPYGGVMVGFRITSYNDTYYNTNSNIVNPYDYGSVYPTVGAFVGAKYNFAKALGAFAELGYDISFFRAGLCLNF